MGRIGGGGAHGGRSQFHAPRLGRLGRGKTMQLSGFLSGATTEVKGKPVAFKVLGTDPEGHQTQAQAEAVFALVPEGERTEYVHHAKQWLDAHGYKGKEIPPDVLVDEQCKWFLMAALRDKDDPTRQFCPN